MAALILMFSVMLLGFGNQNKVLVLQDMDVTVWPWAA
jgi:hypothetical protein